MGGPGSGRKPRGGRIKKGSVKLSSKNFNTGYTKAFKSKNSRLG